MFPLRQCQNTNNLELCVIVLILKYANCGPFEDLVYLDKSILVQFFFSDSYLSIKITTK